jgi:AAA15 family ATPase/GTPase
MITKLSIRNFKSIKELDIDCARVNLFIGEPNTGKSNILEALGILGWCADKDALLSDFVRFEYIGNLFYDNIYDRPFEITMVDNKGTEAKIGAKFDIQQDNFIFYPGLPPDKDGRSMSVISQILAGVNPDIENDLNKEIIPDDLRKSFENIGVPLSKYANIIYETNNRWLLNDGQRKYLITKGEGKFNINMVIDMLCRLEYSGLYKEVNFPMDYKNKIPLSGYIFIKFYKFKEQNKFPSKFPAWLISPNGSNLVSLIIGNKKVRETASNLFKDFGFKMMFREHAETLEQAKLIDDDIYGYPYITVSDTLQRMLFYNAAIDSNENSTLVFEEPEVHAFPAYIKRLGEKIAFDESNQYFIVTHNPYLFLSIVEKTPKDNVNVFATYMKDYQTKVKQANSEQISVLMDYDPFANLGQIIEENDNDSD